ncbi:zinc-dependent metalloprotease [Cyclobacterium xiamenense]|uniref:zinc-dependent metalloprotease n=1 Tax=Cyclobacterium xiamenense TaxID=1297121 RepID=UPI0035CFB6FF
MNATRYPIGLGFLIGCCFYFQAAVAQDWSARSQSIPSISAVTEGMEKKPGFIDLYWDEKTGNLWMAVPDDEQELLYYPSLAAGLGSNDIGLDRGRLSPSQVVRFKAIGSKLLMEAENYTFRASATNPLEQRAVAESFASSVLWGFKILAREDHRILVDATDFFLQDAIGVANSIKRAGQGSYKTDPSRSAIYLSRTKSFPENTEVEASITFTGDQPGNYIREIVPDPKAIHLRIHHSFVRLPPEGFEIRTFDPRAGVNALTYFDYSSKVDQNLEKKIMRRHRLVKKNPGLAPSEVEKPVVYYIDPGTPEPIRSALMEGTSWWAEAFEAAGFINAFQVKLLPEDADPMDVRYHLVQWVHRSSRGWSYGGGVTDPRTGEIIKGKVTLGSLRVRQDYLIAQALAADFDTSLPEHQALMDLALARMRQLAAHEVGHTLGLPHNYIASAKGRTSVMDYPHPTLTLSADGSIDLSNAYAEGIGSWDKVAIKMAYATLPENRNEQEVFDQWVREYRENGLDFLSDQDARPVGSAHPETHLWDNGANPVEELKNVLNIRAKALEGFGPKLLPKGMPLAQLEELLVPVYLLHRYQVEAAAKAIGGVRYGYALKGDNSKGHQTVPREDQLNALDQLLQTLDPQTLAIPEHILAQLPPRPFGYNPDPREVFRRHTGPVFDPIAPAEIAAHHTLTMLLHPERAARLISQRALEPQQVGLEECIEKIFQRTWYVPATPGYFSEIKRSVDKLVLQHLTELAANTSTSPQVKAVTLAKMEELKNWMRKQVPNEFAQKAHLVFCLNQLERFEQNPSEKFRLLEPLPAPAGAPIGQLAAYGAEPCLVY